MKRNINVLSWRNKTTQNAKRTSVPIQTAVALGVALLMLMGGWSAVANHPQSSTVAGQTVTVNFDHDGDNEWWVEVLTKASGGSIVAMSVRAESSSTSHGLQHKAMVDGWTKWGPETSFQIPPGDRVMFRAHVVTEPSGDAGTIDSCFFTHPAGEEQCSSPPSSSFDASFSNVRGNDWWVQADVTANMAIAGVEVSRDGGAFQPLKKQSWGPNAYGGSYHFPQGSILQLRASGSNGVFDFSDCYQWIPPQGGNAAKTSCTTPAAFDATFTNVRGNEWWVQGDVATNGPAVSKVHVTLDDGATWRPLAKQSWGPTAWAGSYHIVQGTVVQLRATAVDGQTDLSSCRQWIPPSGGNAKVVACGSSPPPPEPEEFQVTFSQVAGNRYWQELVVTANKPLTDVVFTTDCKDADEFGVSRNHMQYRPEWGKWVSEGAVMDGSKLTFFAYAENPDTQTGYDRARSGPYLWPSATPTTC